MLQFLMEHKKETRKMTYDMSKWLGKCVFYSLIRDCLVVYKGNNKITELRTILQRENQNS
jgi:hypothetical protein